MIAVQVDVDKMEVVLREFKEPTNVYIFGNVFKNIKATFYTDDDEHDLFITDGNKVNKLLNYGEITILTDKELKENLQNLCSYIDDMVQYMHEYVGKIKLCRINLETEQILDFDKEINLNDYIYHQINEDIEDFCLKVEYGYSTNLYWKPFPSIAILNLI